MDKKEIEKYEMVVGLEVHIQLNSKTKAFSSERNRYGDPPNENVSAISLAHPGTLPKANKKHIEKAALLALALDSNINHFNAFDRKHYFYPDLSKGYQITQDRIPICTGGHLDISVNGKKKRIRIHHIHMEEDAGKSIHDPNKPYSKVDYNRGGTPLVELVTEPDFRSGQEVYQFMAELHKIVTYIGISDGNMEQGSLRCDCNVSIREKGDKTLGQRCEIKNINSKKYAKHAAEFEFERQKKILESGGKVEQRTMNYKPSTGKTTPIRDKEDAHDYRYFPDPDLAPILISEDEILKLKRELPKLPVAYAKELKDDFGLNENEINNLLQEKEIVDEYLKLVSEIGSAKLLANVFSRCIIPIMNETKDYKLESVILPNRLKSFIQIIDSDKVSVSQALQILFPLILGNEEDILKIAERANVLKSTDQDFLGELVDSVLDQNPVQLKKYLAGNKGLIGFFMGQIMRSSKGKADPKVLKKQLTEKLEARKAE